MQRKHFDFGILTCRKAKWEDIQKHQLYVGTADGCMAVIYVLNQECDEEYETGRFYLMEKHI